MKGYQKEIVKLTAKEILLSIFDLALPFFETNSFYRASAQQFKNGIDMERGDYREKIKYLRKQGLIENFIEGKDKYYEITPKGLSRIDNFKSEITEIKRPEIWDKKWRVVVFDIPEKHRVERDIFRNNLIKIGFQSVQESIYVYPFDCTKETMVLAGRLNISDNVLIMISEIIQNEEKIIDQFLTNNVLTKNDLKK